MTWEVRQGDCIEAMRAMPEASVDAVVCDPPYGLSFMGRPWDTFDPANGGAAGAYDFSARGNRGFQAWCEAWATEALRVLKPGGHLLAFGGTRTSHRLVAGIEDAGFEIRDSLVWLYGQGFPKSLNVSKAIAKCAITAPASSDAERWDGWGTALKPAHEPICVARKPLSRTVAATVLAHGTGGLNIDACRITANERPSRESHNGPAVVTYGDGLHGSRAVGSTNEGRWPANVVLSHSPGCEEVGTKRVKPIGATARTEAHGMGQMLNNGGKGKAHPGFRDADGMETVPEWRCVDGCPIRALDEQSGELVSGTYSGQRKGDKFRTAYGSFTGTPEAESVYPGSRGTASRFFYCAKSSRSERNAGLDGLPVTGRSDDGYGSIQTPKFDRATPRENWTPHERRNSHPTVKPLTLMRWLCRLVTPEAGLILDPFAGAGTTGCAAVLEGFDFVGLEREPEYVAIARARIAYWAERRPTEQISLDVV